jgi:phosphoenolpyruvate synthase/pyruvate phosphate dikinase
MTLNWVDQFVPSLTEDENNRLLDDLGELLGIDFEQFRRAVASGDKDRINFQFQRIWKEYTRLMGIMSPTKQTGETLSSLVLIGGLLDSYNVGLKNIKVTTEYQKRYERIKSLQERTTLAETSIKINDYFFWSDGMYCLLLSIKPITSLYYLSNLLPAKAKATGVVLRPIIESHMTTLITAVRESIHKSKEDKK